MQQLGQRVLQWGPPHGVRHHVQLVWRDDRTHNFTAEAATIILQFLQFHAC